jgi:hypothetical protein
VLPLASLVGVLVGAAIAATAQLRVRRSQARERWIGELQGCAEVYALEATFRGAANAAARDGKRERLERWPREERRLGAWVSNTESHFARPTKPF